MLVPQIKLGLPVLGPETTQSATVVHSETRKAQEEGRHAKKFSADS